MLPNLKSIRAFGLLLCILGLWICTTALPVVGSAPAQNTKGIPPKIQTGGSSAPKIYDVDCNYGTLSFKGRIERAEKGGQYKFRVQIAAVFFPGETQDGHTRTNRTKIADLKSCELVATIVTGDDQPVQMLYREAHPIAIRLTESDEVGVLPDLEFTLAKEIADRATHVGLAVTDGRLLWPIAIELR
jgi:hypothetical protein